MKIAKLTVLQLLILFILIFSGFNTTKAFAIEEILNVSIDNTEYLPITVPIGNNVNYYVLQTRSGSPCKMKKSLSDIKYWTIKQNTAIVMPTRIVGRVKILGYIKSTIASDVLEAICVHQNN